MLVSKSSIVLLTGTLLHIIQSISEKTNLLTINIP